MTEKEYYLWSTKFSNRFFTFLPKVRGDQAPWAPTLDLPLFWYIGWSCDNSFDNSLVCKKNCNDVFFVLAGYLNSLTFKFIQYI